MDEVRDARVDNQETEVEIGRLERLGTGIDSLRRWSTMLWRVSVLMAKGAYLLGERRRLMMKLGEQFYDRVQKGEIKDEASQPLVHQLDRLSKKIEIEDMLVRNARFGSPSRAGRSGPPLEETNP